MGELSQNQSAGRSVNEDGGTADSENLSEANLFRGEIGERRTLADVDAERAARADVGEGYFENTGRLLDLGSFHDGAGDILLFVVGGAGCHILIYDNRPITSRRNGIERVGADGNHRSAERELRFSKQSHRRATRCPRLAVGNLFFAHRYGSVAHVDLASIVEVAGGGGGLII